MRNTEFTPGPWDYTDGVVWGVQPDQYGDPEQFKIAECSSTDARLIAAAPDMYESLKEVLRYTKEGGARTISEAMDSTAWIDRIKEQINAAIAKAEGNQP